MSFQNDVILKIQSLKYLMKIDIDQLLQQGITAHEEGKLEEAEKLYREILRTEPKHPDANHNLGILLSSKNKLDEAQSLFKFVTEINPDTEQFWISYINIFTRQKKFEEAEAISRKAIKLNTNFIKVYFKLGFILGNLGRFEEAEINYRKTIELKPDYAEAHSNLGDTLIKLGKLDEAELACKKAIELKSNFAEPYTNLGDILLRLKKFDKAETSFRKAIELKPDNVEAHNNLKTLLYYNKLLLKINEGKKTYKKKQTKHSNTSELDLETGLTSNPFILNRDVEAELINSLYEISSKDLSQTKDVFFGSGRHSTDFKLFEELSKNNYPIIKKVEEDLTIIMQQAVKSDILIMDSFFNILNNGGGSNLHHHLNKFDEIHKLVDQKYSLQYYLTIGDQKCNKPGIFKMHDPEEEVLPSEGMVMIIPAKRKHSAVYNGKTDRVMIGVNFFSLV